MANPSATEINRLDIAVEVNATRANRALLLMANRLDEIAKSLDRLMSKTSGIAAVGAAAEKSVKAMTSVETATKKAGSETKKAAEKTAEIGKAAETAAAKVEKMTDALEKATEVSNKFKTANNVTRSDMESRYREGWKRASTAMSGGNKSEPAQAAATMQDPTKAATADSVTRDVMLARYAAGWRSATAALADHTSATQKQSQAFQESLAWQGQSVEIFRRIATVVGRVAKIGLTLWLKTAATSLQLVASAGKLAWNALKKLPGIFMSAANAAKRLASALRHPIATLKSFFGLDKKAGGGLLGGLLGNRSLAKYVGLIALRRAVTGAIRAIVKGIKEGFENIRQYSSAINSEMYTIQNSLLYVKNAWAAAFAPIISVVKPYVNALLDIIASALNAIGRLVAILTGKGFTVQAVKLSDALYEAGQAGNAAAGGAKNASKAAEEYKKTIMGFDQLNVLNAPNDGSGSGGSGGGGGGGSNSGLNVQDMFKEVDLTGRLKDAIDAGKWEEVGAYFAENVNAFFAKVDEAVKWENVGDKVTAVITAITGVFNGLIDNVNWELLGTTAADGLETFVKAYNLLFNGIEFDDIGEGAADAVNSFVEKVPWAEVGEALVQKFNAIWATGGAFLKGLNYENIGTALGEMFNGGAEKIKLEDVGTAISTALNGITITLKSFTLTFEWSTAKDKVVGFITGLFSKVTARDIVSAGTSIISSVAETLGGALDDTTVKVKLAGFATGLGAALADLGWLDALANTGTKILKSISSNISTAISSFTKAGGWGNLGESIGNAINGILEEDFKAGKIFSNLITGISVTIDKANSTIKWDDLTTNIQGLLTDAMNAISSSDLLTNAGTMLQKLVTALSNALTTGDMPEKIHAFGVKIGNELANLPWIDILATVAGTILTVLSSLLSGVVEGIRNKILKDLGYSDEQIASYESNTNAVQENFNEATNPAPVMSDQDGNPEYYWPGDGAVSAQTFWEKWKGWFEEHRFELSGNMYNIGSMMWEDFTKGSDSKWESVETSLSGKVESIKGFFKDPIGTLQVVVDKASETAINAWNEVKNSEVVKTLKTAGEEAFNTVKENVWDPIVNSDAVKTVKSKVEETFNTAKTKFEEFKDNVAEKGVIGAIKESFFTTKNTFDELKDGEATKELIARTKPGTPSISNTLTKVWDKFTSSTPVKNLVAQTKAGKQKVSDVLTKVWNKLTDGNATKSLFATQKDSFKNNKKTYDDWKDKNVSVTAEANTFRNNLRNPSINVTANITDINGDKWGIWKRNGATGGIYVGGRWRSITAYASGGIVGQTGQMFVAREAGPELVGRIGRHTAIMNNNQIVASVAEGVRGAVADVMAAYAGANQSVPVVVNTTIKTQNDEVLARAVERGMAKRNYRLGTA